MKNSTFLTIFLVFTAFSASNFVFAEGDEDSMMGFDSNSEILTNAYNSGWDMDNQSDLDWDMDGQVFADDANDYSGYFNDEQESPEDTMDPDFDSTLE